jgi:hypothetical protein
VSGVRFAATGKARGVAGPDRGDMDVSVVQHVQRWTGLSSLRRTSTMRSWPLLTGSALIVTCGIEYGDFMAILVGVVVGVVCALADDFEVD